MNVERVREIIIYVLTFLTEQSTVESNVQCIGYSHNFVSVYDCFGPVITRTNSSV